MSEPKPDPKFRRGVWVGAIILVLVALWLAIDWLTADKPGPPAAEKAAPQADARPRLNPMGELQKARKLPEYEELRNMRVKGNRPRTLTAADVARAGELTHHPNFFIRIDSLGTLAHAPVPLQPEAVVFAAPRLHDDVSLVRFEAMDALARLMAKDYVPELAAFLTSADRDEREHARRALRHLGHPGQ